MPRLISGWDYNVWKVVSFDNPYYIWTISFRVEAVASLLGDDRSWAIRMLMFGINIGDSDVAIGLAAMDETSTFLVLQTTPSTSIREDWDCIAQAIDDISLIHDNTKISAVPVQ